MKMFGGSYYFLFLIAITAIFFGTIDTSEICVHIPDFGRVCVPDPFEPGTLKIVDCDHTSSAIRDLEEHNSNFSIRTNSGPVSQGAYCRQGWYRDKVGICRPADGTDCYHVERFCPHGCGGGGAIDGPCPSGTRADQFGKCRQLLRG